MKLSQIKGADAIDVLARIIQPIANIALDKEAMEAIKLKPVEKEGKTPEQIRELALQRIRDAIPAMLGKHRMDICEIIAAIKAPISISHQFLTRSIIAVSASNDTLFPVLPVLLLGVNFGINFSKYLKRFIHRPAAQSRALMSFPHRHPGIRNRP